MRVDEKILGFHVMSGDVQTGNPFGRQSLNEGLRVIAVIDGVDVDVVDVEQKLAVGLFQHSQQEITLRHRLAGRGVVGDVLDRDPPLQDFLRSSYAAGHMHDSLIAKRYRHQIVEMPLIAAIAEVFAVVANVMGVEKAL